MGTMVSTATKAKLQVLETENDRLLNQQKALLQKLDDLQKEAQQARIFASRG